MCRFLLETRRNHFAAGLRPNLLADWELATHYPCRCHSWIKEDALHGRGWKGGEGKVAGEEGQGQGMMGKNNSCTDRDFDDE